MTLRRWPSEARTGMDAETGLAVRQVTTHESIHHHPFFFVRAYDDAMRHLVFISHRMGRPQIFVEERASGDLLQLTDRDDLAEWSVIPAADGRWIYFVAGAGAYRVDSASGDEEQLADFGQAEMRASGMVGAAMGTTALSADGRWWAIPVKTGPVTRFWLVDTLEATSSVIIERDTIGHPQFCPDDDDLILYAGPMTDRVWVTDRSGTGNRRLYERENKDQWVTHEVWWPGRRSVLFVDWPRGLRVIDVGTGAVRWVGRFPVWHCAPSDDGARLVCDTNFPDRGLHLLDLTGSKDGEACFLHRPEASSRGDHWAGPFPYNDGPVKVHAPQHTHPHPRFSPDASRVVFTSDRSGRAQVYEMLLAG